MSTTLPERTQKHGQHQPHPSSEAQPPRTALSWDNRRWHRSRKPATRPEQCLLVAPRARRTNPLDSPTPPPNTEYQTDQRYIRLGGILWGRSVSHATTSTSQRGRQSSVTHHRCKMRNNTCTSKSHTRRANNKLGPLRHRERPSTMSPQAPRLLANPVPQREARVLSFLSSIVACDCTAPSRTPPIATSGAPPLAQGNLPLFDLLERPPDLTSPSPLTFLRPDSRARRPYQDTTRTIGPYLHDTPRYPLGDKTPRAREAHRYSR